MWLAAFCALTAQLSALPQQLDAAFELTEGLSVRLWAESPDLYNPTAIDVDARGRVWVTEAVNYRKWTGNNQGREHPDGDRVVVLEDRDGDGRAEHSTVFAQSEDLVAPLGICLLPGGRVLVSCSPALYLYTDRDGDLVADERETLLTGWGGTDHDHGLHSAAATHDGRLLLVAGNAGPHRVEDKDGWNLRSSSFAGGGTPGLVSDDGRTHVGGLILRMNPDGSDLRVLADNLRNPYEAAMDSFGRAFTADNDDDGNRACRTAWVFEGADYGYASPDGVRSWRADLRPGQDRLRAHWHADDPGSFPPGTINGAGGPTGVCVYEAGLPSDPMYALNGAVLNADAGAGVVYAHLPRRKGAGVELLPSTLLQGKPTETEGPGGKGAWFRPSDVAVAPDGSILVADWYDPRVGGHGAGDREAYGRILRVHASGVLADPESGSLVLPQPAGEAGPYDRLLDGLVSPTPAERMEAFEALAAAGDGAFDALHGLAGHSNPHQAARPLWLLARLQPRGVGFVEQLFHQPIPELRRAAWLALVSAGTQRPEHLARVVMDDDPGVRIAAAPYLRDLPWETCSEELLALALRYPGTDRAYLEALGIAAEGKEAELYAAAREALGGEEPDWFRLAPLAFRLHPVGIEAEILTRLQSDETASEERALLLDALAFIPSRAAAEAMLTLALAGPRDLRPLAKHWSQTRATNLWRAYDLKTPLQASSLEEAVRVFQSPVLRGSKIPLNIEGLEEASVLWLVARDGGDGNSYDWASWVNVAFEGEYGRMSLAELGWMQAKSGWGEVRAGASCGGGPLVVDGETYADGIGMHANGQAAFAVPEGTWRIVGLAGPDAGGTSQGGGTSVIFEVHLEGKSTDRRQGELRAQVQDPALAMEARIAAAEELSETAGGGFALVELARTDSLPPVLLQSLAPALHGSPDFALRALASGLFPREDRAGPPLPALAELAAMPGDRLRGAEVFFGKTAGCATCHRVRERGGDVGPDLSAIGSKYGRAELLDAILNPSAAIAHGFETWMVETADGRVLAGRILADGEDLLLQDTAGRRQVIAAEDVIARHRSSLSSMPDNVALGLSKDELSDLASFLTWAPPTDLRFGPEQVLFDGSQGLIGWVPFLADSAADPANTWSVKDGVLRCEGSPRGYLRTERIFDHFELRLQWRFDPEAGPGNSGVLLRTLLPDKVWPRSIEAQLKHRHAGDIWNIDRVPMLTDITRLKGRRTTKRLPSSERSLGEWNDYRIRLVHGTLELEVNGIPQNTATWCDETPGHICLQSEGAVIEFRDITLRELLPQ